jgi:molecular chaperone GrpE (heat shock protein)
MFEKDRVPKESPAEYNTPDIEASSKEATDPPGPPGIDRPEPLDAVAPAPEEAMEPARPEAVAPTSDEVIASNQPEAVAPTAAKLSGEDPALERLSQLETLLEEFIATGSARDRRMEENNRTMRAYFTDELGRLREAITDELRDRAALRLLQDVVPILNDLDDLLERSKEAAQDETTARLWRALEAFRRRFYNGLLRLGLEEVHVVENETMFDPYIHECVDARDDAFESDAEEISPDTIVKVKRRGYMFQNELFQAPQVIIQGGQANDIS